MAGVALVTYATESGLTLKSSVWSTTVYNAAPAVFHHEYVVLEFVCKFVFNLRLSKLLIFLQVPV